MPALILQNGVFLARRGDASSMPGCGCFAAIAIIVIVIFLVRKSRQDRQALAQQSPVAPRPAEGQGPLGSHTFACPYPKCPNCGANAEKMKQQWDGLRKVTWTCGYCGAVQVQDLRDEELPPSARQRLGLDPVTDPNQPVYPHQGGGMGGVGGLLTGMMIGSMMGGDHHHHHDDDDWGNGGGSGGSGGDSGWGDSDNDGGGWGDSGGDDFGGGGDSGDWS